MKIVSLLLALLMLMSFAACAKDPVDPVDSGSGDTAGDTTPAETTADPLLDNLPEETFDGEDILIWIGSPQPYYHLDEDEYIEGDVIDEAIIERNDVVTDRFDVTLNYNRDRAGAFWRDMGVLRQSILGGDEYDVIEGVATYTSPLALYGCYVDMNQNDFIDFSKPWWQPYANEAMTIAGRQYLASGYFSFTTLTRAALVFFNANMVEDYELGNLYELVNSGDWTWDKMVEMCEIVGDDVNQDGIYDEQDNYGFSSRWDSWILQPSTAGYQYITFDEEGTPHVTGLTEGLLEMSEKVYPMTNTSNLHFSRYKLGVHSRFPSDVDNMAKQMFCNDQILFMLEDINWAESDMARDFGAYGLLPSPKYMSDQENYGTSSSNFAAAICVTTGNYRTTSIILEALEAESYKILRPAYFDVAMSYKYLNDPEAVKVLDLVFANISCDFAYNFGGAGIGSQLSQCLPRNENLASFFQSQTSVFESQLETFMEQFESLPEYIPE